MIAHFPLLLYFYKIGHVNLHVLFIFYFSHFFLTISAQLKTLSQSCLNLRENLFHVTKGQDVVASQLLQQGRYQALPEGDFLLKQCRLGLQKASQLLPPQQLLLDPLDKWMYGQV